MAKAKKRTEAQLRKIMADGYAATQELADRQEAKQTKENAALIGQCQRYRNSCGSDEKWWLYRKILTVTGNRGTAFSFQEIPDGRIEIHKDKYAFLDMDGYQPISQGEFDNAWRDLMATLRNAPVSNSEHGS